MIYIIVHGDNWRNSKFDQRGPDLPITYIIRKVRIVATRLRGGTCLRFDMSINYNVYPVAARSLGMQSSMVQLTSDARGLGLILSRPSMTH